MEGLMGLMTLIILGSGLYCLWAWYQMKTTGEINETLLLGKQFQAFQCKNKEEFVAKSLPAVLTLGIFTTLYGVFSLVHTMWLRGEPILAWVDAILMIVVLVNLIRFGYATSKLRKMYFN